MHPLQQVIPEAVARLLRDAPLSPGKVAFAWRSAVGPAVERVTAVRLEAGTLIVEAATPQWTREIARGSGMILTRVRSLLGADTVRKIVVRTAPHWRQPSHPPAPRP